MRILRRILLMLLIIWIAASLHFIMPPLSDRNPVAEVIAASLRESRGTMEGCEEAVARVVNGFGKGVLQALPREFAMGAQGLVAISLEGSVG